MAAREHKKGAASRISPLSFNRMDSKTANPAQRTIPKQHLRLLSMLPPEPEKNQAEILVNRNLP
jgi:hypothetical protein